MKKFEIGDEEYTDEVNTSFTNDKTFGSPSNYPAAGGEPIDAKTGQDFMDISYGEEVWKLIEILANEANDSHDAKTGKFTSKGAKGDDKKIDSIIDSQINKDINKGIQKVYHSPKSTIHNKEKADTWQKEEDQGIPHKGTHERRVYDKVEKYMDSYEEPEHADDVTRYARQFGIDEDEFFNRWSDAGGMYEEEIAQMEGEEKLNKDGTGIKRATRGINPNKTPWKTLKFEYVSNSDCPICKPFDGKTFTIDSPNRPIIPRLESQGSRGSRPYTHPNCKCKWRTVFHESKAIEISPKTIERAKKLYGDGFDDLTKTEQNMVMIKMLTGSLRAKEYGIKGVSGKRGHKKWMLEGEASSECETCMINTDKDDNGKCILCGN